MKYIVWGLLLFSTFLQGAPVTWTDEGTVGGLPNHRWNLKENWSGDLIPGPGDDVIIASSGGTVELFESSATVNTIDSTFPFKLSSTLTITTSGVFDNSVLVGGDGVIEANGPVIFRGFNDLKATALSGPAGYTNEGDIPFASKGISVGTPFINNKNVFLNSGLTRLGNFTNNGTFEIGGGTVATGTNFINQGTIQKTTTEPSSSIFGTLVQKEGKVMVPEGAELEIATDVQQYLGGEIVSNGTINLTGTDAEDHSRTFDGLTGISGDGTVNQVRDFNLLKDLTVNLPNTPGYEVGGFTFGDLSSSGGALTFTNEGYLTIDDSPMFLPADPDDELSYLNNTFVNSKNGTVNQDNTSNPSFGVTVENAGTWTSYGMKVQAFENTGRLDLEGQFGSIDPVDSESGGTLSNLGEVRLGFKDATFSTISVEYDQSARKTTNLNYGGLTLDGGSQELAGTFEISSRSSLKINRGSYQIPSHLIFKGKGLATVGGNQLMPEILADVSGNGSSRGSVRNELGFDSLGLLGQAPVDNPEGLFRMRSGSMKIDVSNRGYMNWSGGTIKNNFTVNYGRLDISAGAPRILDGRLLNVAKIVNPVRQNNGLIVQTSSLTLKSPDAEDSSEVSFTNDGTHIVRSGASISGGGGLAYINDRGTLISENNASVSISCTFFNKRQGTVHAKDASILGFTNSLNISETGVLSGGTWKVEEDAEIIFLHDIKVLSGSNWEGPGARTVTSVDKFSSLTKTTNEVHSVRLEVQGVVALVGDTKTIIPSVDLKNGGKIKGTGELVGDLNAGSGIVTTGDSAGTLTITGNTTFTPESTFEWEADSSSNSDLLQINTGTATLAGMVRPVFINGYVPLAETTFTILNSPTIVGTFDGIDDTALPTGMIASLGYTPTSVTLTVNWSIALQNSDAWKIAQFSEEELANDLISGLDADPDKDGLINLQEYVHGTLPKSADQVPVQLSDANESFIELTFPWVDGISDAFFQTELGDDLENFFPVQHSVVSSESTGGVTRYRIRIEINNTGPPAFVRLRTIQNEL